MPRTKKPNTAVIDLFCGAGGLSHGFVQEGFNVVAGIDVDEACRYPYEANNDAQFIQEGVESLNGKCLDTLFGDAKFRVLVGCAPCQPFSKLNQKNNDNRWNLLDQFASLVEESLPDVVSMENVPQLAKFQNGKLFERFIDRLNKAGYSTTWGIAYCPDYGVPQSRSRLVLLASRHGDIDFPKKTHPVSKYKTVRQVIENLPVISDGQVDSRDPLHKSSKLAPQNRRRIKASRPGGTWREWPKNLLLECHKKDSGQGYSSVYGRMEYDKPSPTITTQFYGLGTGRFGHPQQDRALSLREGALLQSFPKGYKFIEPGSEVVFKNTGRLIGNAVPVRLGRVIARSIRKHIGEL